MRLHRTMTVRAAFVAIARGSIDRVSNKTSSNHLESGPESVHQLRVAIRRLRAAFSAFQAVIPKRDRQHFRDELRWLQGEFGPAREWDVLIDETFVAAARCRNSREALHPLIGVAERRRGAAYARSHAALRNRRSHALMLDLATWLEGPPWSARPQACDKSDLLDLPIGRLAARELAKCHHKVFKLGSKIDELDTERLHELRIRVKKLRYATEFFQDLWPGGAAETYVQMLKRFQDSLGGVHDALVNLTLVDDLASEMGREGERGVALIRTWLNRHVERGREKLAGRWHELAELAPFWTDDGGE